MILLSVRHNVGFHTRVCACGFVHMQGSKVFSLFENENIFPSFNLYGFAAQHCKAAQGPGSPLPRSPRNLRRMCHSNSFQPRKPTPPTRVAARYSFLNFKIKSEKKKKSECKFKSF